MDELVEKLSLYDCLVRLITGSLVILITYYSGLVDTFWEVGDSSIIVFGFCSYGVGMILEEVSYMLKMRRKNNRNETCVENNEEWNKKKEILLRDNKEYISDEPLAHKVMVDSIEIASILIILWKVIKIVYDSLVCGYEVDILSVFVNIAVLGVIAVIMDYRKKHYKQRREERIQNYYSTKSCSDEEIKENDEENKCNDYKGRYTGLCR